MQLCLSSAQGVQHVSTRLSFLLSLPPGHYYNDGSFMTDEYDICCKDSCFLYEWEHSLTLPHVAQVFRINDYLDIARRADEIYAENGVAACQAYLGSGQVRDAIMAIDLGL